MVFGYPFHYFVVDKNLGLTVNDKWIQYRMGIALLALVGFAMSFIPRYGKTSVTRIYLGLLGLVTAYFQSVSMSWSSQVHYLWSIFIIVAFASFLRISLMPTLIYCIAGMYIQLEPHLSAGVDIHALIGSNMVGLSLLAILRSRTKDDVRIYIEQQEKIVLERLHIDKQKEMTAYLFKITPKVIKDRLLDLIENQRYNVFQAMNEVLRIRRRNIACIFSDIRGYTNSSKSDTFLDELAIPNMKHATSLVETNGGIPRRIGDLIFAYYDSDDFVSNFKNAVNTCLDIYEMNDRQSQTQQTNEASLKRYILLDVGEARVGNFGSIDSSLEITALGSCVNRAARIDEITKNKIFVDQLGNTAIVMSDNAGRLLKTLYPEAPVHPIDLAAHGIQIRDFPEEVSVWVITDSKDIEQISRLINSKTDNEPLSIESKEVDREHNTA
jgi:class 3 adenylate cyclase